MILNKALIVIAVIAILGVIYLATLGYISRNGKPPGLLDGKLQACPDRPNCVCSEYPDDGAGYIAPLELTAAPAASALQGVAEIVQQLGGVIVSNDDNYLAATFKSSVLGFVDDVEFRADSELGVLQVRSASRVGRSDFGANRERIENLRQRWQER